jgi:hypothetical protein
MEPKSIVGMIAAIACLAQGLLSGEPDTLQMASRIDQLMAQAWADRGIEPSPVADDFEFLRRVSLDLNGVTPPVAKVRDFTINDDPAKRQHLIDELIDSPRFATHLANTFRDIILPLETPGDPRNNAGNLQRWLRRQFVANLRYDRLVSEFLSATGDEQEGPAVFYRALEAAPEKLAAATSRVFLGLQIECAQCHDHPFDHWTQKDFWGYAAFFARVRPPDGMTESFRLVDAPEGEVTLPDSDEVVYPQYPGGSPADEAEGGTRRMQLSIWMASRDNPYLARATVNRVWSLMFGKGLVDPVDDLGPHHPASHPVLLAELTDYFVSSGFDLRELFRVMANSQVYQRSSRSVSQNESIELFERMHLRPLTPDQLFDSLCLSLMLPNTFNDEFRQTFVRRMRSASRDRTHYTLGLQQALSIMNGQPLEAASRGQSGILAAIQAPFFDDRSRLDTLFLATLSRYPDDAERQIFESHITADGSPEGRHNAFGDVLWALVNSAEYQLNH